MTAFPCFAMCGDPACETLGCVRVYNDRHRPSLATIPGADPGACPECGRWRKAGMVHRCRMTLSEGEMHVSVSPDIDPATLAALRAVGEAATRQMKEDAMDLIGKKATIVGYSEDGAPDQDFVAHICLDIEDGPRVFFQATDTKATWRIVEEPRA